MTRPADDPLFDDDQDEPLPPDIEHEHALVGAALVDPVVADLVLAETDPGEFFCPLAQRAFLALRRWAKLDPIRFAMEPAADLVREELGDDVDYLIADRPALRHARAALRAAATEIGRVQDEPLVQLAAVELEAELQRGGWSWIARQEEAQRDAARQASAEASAAQHGSPNPNEA